MHKIKDIITLKQIIRELKLQDKKLQKKVTESINFLIKRKIKEERLSLLLETIKKELLATFSPTLPDRISEETIFIEEYYIKEDEGCYLRFNMGKMEIIADFDKNNSLTKSLDLTVYHSKIETPNLF